MSLDKEIFSGKTLSDLFGEIYDNSKETKGQVKALIGELKPLIENIGDATLIVPMIKEYMEIGVKNDEQLIKVGTILQRVFQNQDSGAEGFSISDEEREQLLREIDNIQNSQEPPKQLPEGDKE